MRTRLVLGFLLLASACASEPGALVDPPLLTITSPQRATMREEAGLIQVTGTVAPSVTGARISKVTVNGVQASVAGDGSFSADVPLSPGATFLHTEARDVDGGVATDTRTVQAGALRSGSDLVEHGVKIALSDDALATISAAASTLMKTTDFAALLAPMNPVINAGAEDGEDCLWGKVSVNDVKLKTARISLVPHAGSLAFEAEVTNLDVPATARYKAACFIGGTTDIRMKASRILVKGNLLVTPKAGGAGFNVKIVQPDVAITGFDLEAGGLPGTVLNILHLDTAIGGLLSLAVEHFMSPLMNSALGGLAGPKQIDLLGKPLTFEMAADSVGFDVVGATVGLDTRMHLAGNNARFIYTPNAPIELPAGDGFALALSDDAANQLLASVTASGMLSLTLPATGGTFDSATLSAVIPPMVSADGTTGKLRLLAGDMMMTFKAGQTEVAHVAINLSTELTAKSSGFGGVALALDKPEVFADVVDNASGYGNDDQEAMIKLVVDEQVKLMSLLFSNIPLPTIAGVKLDGLDVSAGEGFIKITGELKNL